MEKNNDLENKIFNRAENIQEECHLFVEEVLKLANKENKQLKYEDITNVYLFKKIAELEIELNQLRIQLQLKTQSNQIIGF